MLKQKLFLSLLCFLFLIYNSNILLGFNNSKKRFYTYKIYSNYSYILGEPVLTGNSIVGLSYYGNIIKIQNNKIIWINKASSSYKNYFNSYLFKKNNLIFFISELKKIICIDIRNGKLLWSTELDTPIRYGIIIYKNNLIVQSTSSSIYSIKISTGKIKWLIFLLNENIYEIRKAIFFIHRKHIISQNNLGIYILNAKNSKLTFRYLYNYSKIINLTKNKKDIIFSNKENIIFTDKYGYLYNFNLCIRSHIWIKKYKFIDLINTNDNNLIAFNNNTLISINILNGNILWKKSVSYRLKKKILKYFYWNHYKLTFL